MACILLRVSWVFEWHVLILEDGEFVIVVGFIFIFAVLLAELLAGLVSLKFLLFKVLLLYVANDDSLDFG